MREPDLAIDYHERDVQAVHAVLIELGQVLGAFRKKFVIVGGAVPWLLLPHAQPQHIGTLDIDLDLDPVALADGEYASFVEALEKAGYERDLDDLRPFQLRRWVKMDDGEPIAVLVDLLMPRDAETRPKRKKRVPRLRVQRTDGGEVALKYHFVKDVSGHMPDGRPNKVELRIASIPALLVMKGFALEGRDKKKDAYDIYFVIRNFEAGLDALADACRPLLVEAVARQGYEKIAKKFRSHDDFGPATVRAFLAQSQATGEMTPEQIQMDAFKQVAALMQALQLA